MPLNRCNLVEKSSAEAMYVAIVKSVLLRSLLACGFLLLHACSPVQTQRISYSSGTSDDGRYGVFWNLVEKRVRLIEVASGRILQAWQGAEMDEMGGFDFSPDSRYLVVFRNHAVELWDLHTAQPPGRFSGESGVRSLALSPDGRRLAIGDGDGALVVWDLTTHRQVWRVSVAPQTQAPGAWGLSFSQTGRLLAASNFGFLNLYDAADGRLIREMQWKAAVQPFRLVAGLTSKMVFSHDDRRLAAGLADLTVAVWDVDSGTEVHRLTGHLERPRRVGFDPTGRYLLSLATNYLHPTPHHQWETKIWDLQTGRQVSSASLTDFGAVTSDGYVRLWDPVQNHSQTIVWTGPSLVKLSGVAIDQAVPQLARTLTASLDSSRAQMAVSGLTVISEHPGDLDRYLEEELITALMGTGRVRIVERSLLNKALEELGLQRSDLVDPKHAKSLGRMTGADSLLVGSVVDAGGSLRVNLRVVNVETGEVTATAGAKIAKTPAVLALQGLGGSTVTANKPPQAEPRSMERPIAR